MSKSIVTPVARASFPSLVKPDQFNKYSLSMLFPKSDPKVIEFVKWLKEAVSVEALAIAGQKGQALAISLFTNFKDGDNPESFTTYRAEYAGHFILNMSRKPEFGRPCIVNRNKQPIDPSEIYAGCNILAYIDVYGYKFGTKKSVTVGIQHIMKTGENTPFTSTGVEVEDAFSSLNIPDEGENVTDTYDLPEGVEPSTPAQGPINPFSGV